MYSYTYDKETGGLLLHYSPTVFSKEPRPVYAAELDLLGFGQYWNYQNQTDLPYLWAEANFYYYRGVMVAKLKGGNVYTAPEIILTTDETGAVIEPEPHGEALRPVDVATMVEKNREILGLVEQTTVKKIVDIYGKYYDKLDCFHVAFSGGKDSCVLLDLVKKALPKGSFVVVFGDTGMEFPDTYELVKEVSAQCDKENIPFYEASSHFSPEESWTLFGPPSRTLRWCCSVHKSTPQMLKLREITKNRQYKGLAFVGVRGHESVARSKYDYFNNGKKIKGQYDFYPILEWTSAEVWLYMYASEISINHAYKLGNSRAGCLFCPMSSGNSDFMRYNSYPEEVSLYLDLIKNTSSSELSESRFKDLVDGGSWAKRGDGRCLASVQSQYREETQNGTLLITVIHPSSDWKEWMKTHPICFEYKIENTDQGYIVQVEESVAKKNITDMRFFRQIFKKSTFCKDCQVCEANCVHNCISFEQGKLRITNCKQCGQCHDLTGGCLRYDSLKLPNGGTKKKMRAINAFNDHAPKTEWFRSFFNLK